MTSLVDVGRLGLGEVENLRDVLVGRRRLLVVRLVLRGHHLHGLAGHDGLLGRVHLGRVDLELVVPTQLLHEQLRAHLHLERLVITLAGDAAKVHGAGQRIALVTFVEAGANEGDRGAGRLVLAARPFHEPSCATGSPRRPS